jgi:putative flippase GtrA
MNGLMRQLTRFGCVGAVAVSIDFAVYRGLAALTGLTHGAKAVSFILATVVAYLLNRHWAFGAPGGAARLAGFAALYSTTFLVNVGVNAWMLWLLPGDVAVAFLTAQAASTTINFVMLRSVVFPVTVAR